MKKTIFIYTIIIFATIFYFGFNKSTNAAILIEGLNSQEKFGDFLVGPGKTEIELKPGESKTFNLTISNRIGVSKTFLLETEDFTASSNLDQTVVLLEDEKGPYSLKDYISFPSSSILLNHSERATVPITISIPDDAEPGGLYGSVIVSTQTDPNDDNASAKAALITRIGVLIFVNVPGEVKKEGKVEKFSTWLDKKFFFNNNPIRFQILYRNTGNIHLNPYGQITVRNIFGATVGQADLDPWFAMPQSLRSREINWDKGHMIGRYVATLSLNRGYENIVETHTKTFYVFPMKFILIAFAGVTLVIMFFVFIFSKFEIKKKD